MGTKSYIPIVTNCIYNNARDGRKIQKGSATVFDRILQSRSIVSINGIQVGFQFSTDDHGVTEKYKNNTLDLLLFTITPLLS